MKKKESNSRIPPTYRDYVENDVAATASLARHSMWPRKVGRYYDSTMYCAIGRVSIVADCGGVGDGPGLVPSPLFFPFTALFICVLGKEHPFEVRMSKHFVL